MDRYLKTRKASIKNTYTLKNLARPQYHSITKTFQNAQKIVSENRQGLNKPIFIPTIQEVQMKKTVIQSFFPL